MRFALIVLTGMIAIATTGTARADQYKWCMVTGGGDDGGMMNCYFVTLQQCQMAVSGVGGFCMPSPFAGNRPASTWGETENPPPPQRKKKS